MSTRDQYSTVTHNVREEKMEDGQPAPNNILSAILPGLINMAGAGIPAMSASDLCMFSYATNNRNLHEEKMKNRPEAPDNSLSVVPPGRSNMSGACTSSRSTRDLCDSPVTAMSSMETAKYATNISCYGKEI
uniref:sarcoma antigen 1-like n=1 Tax=Callithrix jacchus TaxID=9483 RepID=UPI0023DD4646|nr:sarcoma antigen 1-like [Callithrix jacchus]